MKHVVLFLSIALWMCLPLQGFESIPMTPSQKESFGKEAMIISGNANRLLAEKVAAYLDIPLGNAVVDTFNDGEIQIHINDNIKNKHVFILQPTCPSKTQSINDNFMELYLLARTLKRASSASITAIIPYYGYSRQDRKTSPRTPISAADLALMIEASGVDRVVTIDLHCGQIQGFFQNTPVENLYTTSMFASYFISKDLKNIVVVAPDAGGVDRANKLITAFRKRGIESHLALISKQRAKAGVVSSMGLIGDVFGSDAIIVDDICDTGGTLVKAAALLKDKGASRVFTAITHPVFSKNALENIKSSSIDEMVVTDTIPLKGEPPENIHQLSVSPLLGEAIRRIYLGESFSELFD